MDTDERGDEEPDLSDDEARRIVDLLRDVQWHDSGEGFECNYCRRIASYDHGATRPWLPDCGPGPLGPCRKPPWLNP